MDMEIPGECSHENPMIWAFEFDPDLNQTLIQLRCKYCGHIAGAVVTGEVSLPERWEAR